MKRDKRAKEFEVNTSKTMEELTERAGKINKYLAFTVIEVVVLLIYSVLAFSKPTINRDYSADVLNENADERKFETPADILPKGIYQVTVSYEAEGDGCLAEIMAESNIAKNVFADQVGLIQSRSERTFTFWANHDLKNFRVSMKVGDATALKINKVNVSTSSDSAINQVIGCLGILILFNLAALVLHKKDKIRNYKDTPIIIGLIITIFISSYPLYVDYMLFGHDMFFHLLRIEGIKDGLLSGQFPVRIQPNWVWGYGYPTSIFYGDTMLYFPALLRMVGVPVLIAYKCYVFLINAGTVLISYYCFWKVSKNKQLALITSVIYSLAVYRLVCVYVRGAVGEYTAMMFLPMVVCGFFLILGKATEDKNYKQQWPLLALGLSGLIQTHELSCEMIIPFMILACVICWKKFIRKDTIILFAKTAGITILLNLWFLIPFLSYLSENFNLKSSWSGSNIQSFGASIAEIFAFSTVTKGSVGLPITPIGWKTPVTIGAAILVVMLVGLLVLFNSKYTKLSEETRGIITKCGILGLLALVMSTNVCPYDILSNKIKLISKFSGSVQFPWRFLSIAIPLLCLFGNAVMQAAKVIYKKKQYYVIVIVICALACLQGFTFLNDVAKNNDTYMVYDSVILNTNEIFDGFFLIQGSDKGRAITEQQPVTSNAECSNYMKTQGIIKATCKSVGQGAYIDFPMFNYKGYVAYDINTKEKFDLALGDNNRIRVILPDGYNGTVMIHFEENPLWKFANWISLISIIVLILKRLKVIDMVVAHMKKRIYNRNGEKNESSNDIS